MKTSKAFALKHTKTDLLKLMGRKEKVTHVTPFPRGNLSTPVQLNLFVHVVITGITVMSMSARAGKAERRPIVLLGRFVMTLPKFYLSQRHVSSAHLNI